MDQEIQLLEGMERLRDDPGDHVAGKPEAAALPPARQRPIKPIVITKEMLQVLSNPVSAFYLGRERKRVGYKVTPACFWLPVG